MECHIVGYPVYSNFGLLDCEIRFQRQQRVRQCTMCENVCLIIYTGVQIVHEPLCLTNFVVYYVLIQKQYLTSKFPVSFSLTSCQIFWMQKKLNKFTESMAISVHFKVIASFMLGIVWVSSILKVLITLMCYIFKVLCICEMLYPSQAHN